MDPSYTIGMRQSLKEIKETYNTLKTVDYIDKIINSLPYMAAILNYERQVVFANKKFFEILHHANKNDVLGERPGEILHCINSDKEVDGCGTSKNCSVCGAVESIIEAQKTNRPVTYECRITSREDDKLVAYDFNATTTPFQWKNKNRTYYLFSLIDISDEKRRKNLERMFFHDILNRTGSFNGFVDLIKQEKDIKKIKEFIDLFDIIVKDLNDEILSYRQMSLAEAGELMVDVKLNNSLELLNSIVAQIQFHDLARDKHINILETTEELEFNVDEVILRRVLINMIKNALEAAPTGEIVSIGCTRAGSQIVFEVKNPGFIQEIDQLKIFQRSFSTRGINRGLGTYSMKLLGENYLKGRVGFESNRVNGTKFYISLPFDKPDR